MTDIFEFWSHMRRGEKIHPADISVVARMSPEKHGFNLECLPAAFGGRLRTAPVVLLYLSPGFSQADLTDANTIDGKDYYVRRWKGNEPMRDVGGSKGTQWMVSRTKMFGSYEDIRNHVALLNIGAYHSKDVRSYAALTALPSSRVSLDWAQRVLFPAAENGERIVVCMRSASYWGLETGRRYGSGLFAPKVTRQGHLLKSIENQELIRLVRERLHSKHL
jgi:hypothetical protein